MAVLSKAEQLARLQDMLTCAKLLKLADELADAAESAINCKPHGMSNLLFVVSKYRAALKGKL